MIRSSVFSITMMVSRNNETTITIYDYFDKYIKNLLQLPLNNNHANHVPCIGIFDINRISSNDLL